MRLFLGRAKLKTIQLAQITPHIFDGKLIFSLDGKWIEACQGIPQFTAVVDEEGKLVLVGPKICQENQNCKEKKI